MVNMAKYSNLNWDVILGAEVVGHYKPVQMRLVRLQIKLWRLSQMEEMKTTLSLPFNPLALLLLL